MRSGQVYVPQVNWALMVSTIVIVIGFGSSTALAAAYGIAVTLTMVITAVLLYVVATERWHWPPAVAFMVTGLFLSVDLAFFGANVLKILYGGWLPLVIGAAIFTLMTTWKTGRRIVAERLTARAIPLEAFLEGVQQRPPARVSGTAVFMTAQPRGAPAALAHNLRYNKVLHKHVIILMVNTRPVPHVTGDECMTIRNIGGGLFELTLRYGFMEDPDVPAALGRAHEQGLELDPDDVTYFFPRPLGHRQHEQRQQRRRHEPADDDRRQRALHFGALTRRDRHRNEAEARHERGHQHRPQPTAAPSRTAVRERPAPRRAAG